MNDQTPAAPMATINPWNVASCVGALVFMFIAIWSDNILLLKFTHLMAGVLWTGIDLFMGFWVGPALRAAPFEARRAVITRLSPKTLFVMPTLATITGTSGWYHARQLGFLDLPWPGFGWVAAALVLIAILTAQGLGILLPTNARVFLELRKSRPDEERIARLMNSYTFWVSSQGLGQVLMIVIMAKFATGL